MHIATMAAAGLAAPTAPTVSAAAAASAAWSTAQNEWGGNFCKIVLLRGRQFTIPGQRAIFRQGRKIPPTLAASVSVCCPPPAAQEKHGNSSSGGGGGCSPWSSPTSSSSSSSAPRVGSAFNSVMQLAAGDEEDSKKVKPPTSSALAIAAAAGASVSSAPLGFIAKSDFPGQQLLSPPSTEFLALCAEQLSLCQKIVGHDTKLTVYVRTAESYATGRLEFFLAAISPEDPSWSDLGAYKEVLLLTDKSESQRWIGLVESALVQREAVELPELSTFVLPLVKDVFLVGLLVIERTPTIKPTMRSKQIPRLKPVRPSWPPKETGRLLPPTDNAEAHALDSSTKSELVKGVEQLHTPISRGFSKDQQAEAAKIARTVALACVMDQRSVLLQQSAWQKGIHIDNLVDQVRGPLMAVRTLGKMLLPQLKRGEISRDVVEGILVQGDRMNEVVQQIQKTDAGSQQYHYNFLQAEMNGHTSLSNGDSSLDELRRLPADAASLEMDGLSQKDSGSRQRSSSSLPVEPLLGDDHEAPPIVLATSSQGHISLCNVSEILNQLVRAGSSLAEQNGKDLQLKSHSAGDIPLMAAIDEISLRQALSNLLEYSIHHTTTGGWISAEAMGAPGGGVLVVIEDNGPGMGFVVQEPGPLGSSFAASKSGSRSNEQRAFEAGRRLIAAREILEPWGAVLHIRSPFLVDAPVGAGGTHMEIWLPIGMSDHTATGVRIDAQESSLSN